MGLGAKQKGGTADREVGWGRSRCLEGRRMGGRKGREVPPEGIITSKSVHSHYHGIDGRSRAVLSGGRGGCALINTAHLGCRKQVNKGKKRNGRKKHKRYSFLFFLVLLTHAHTQTPHTHTATNAQTETDRHDK